MLVPGYHFSATEDYFHSVSRINTLMPFQRGESGVTEVGETSHHKYKQLCPPFLNLQKMHPFIFLTSNFTECESLKTWALDSKIWKTLIRLFTELLSSSRVCLLILNFYLSLCCCLYSKQRNTNAHREAIHHRQLVLCQQMQSFTDETHYES